MEQQISQISLGLQESCETETSPAQGEEICGFLFMAAHSKLCIDRFSHSWQEFGSRSDRTWLQRSWGCLRGSKGWSCVMEEAGGE